MFYSSKRQAFLVDQGYAFKVITHLAGLENMEGLAFKEAQERRELLQDVMLQNEMSADVEKIDDDFFSARSSRRIDGGGGGGSGGRLGNKVTAKRMAGQLSELSGGQDMAYVEYSKGRNKELKGSKAGQGPQNSFIKKLQRENEKRKAANR